MRFGECPEGWNYVHLPALGELNRGRSRHRPRHAPELYGGPYPFLQTGDIKAARGKITSWQQTYSDVGLAQSRLWPAGTLCITIAANIAETAILGFPACFPDSIIGFIPHEQKCDLRFIEYMFRRLRSSIQHVASESGTVQDNINLDFLERLEFPLPDDPAEQTAIADVLSALDEKIQLNQDASMTLEAIARALYRSWFVDFDPVIARVERQNPLAFDDTVASLFPREFLNSDMGPIPASWRISTVGQEFSVIMGQAPAGSSYNEIGDGYPFFQGRSDFGWRYPKRRMFCSAAGKIAEAGDILMTVRAPVGDLNVANERCVIGRGLAAIRAPQTTRSFALYSLMHLETELDVFEGDGTLFGAITKDDLLNLEIVLPPPPVLAAFAAVADPIDQRIATVGEENSILEELRELLLPKLMSGEIRLKHAEKLVSDAV